MEAKKPRFEGKTGIKKAGEQVLGTAKAGKSQNEAAIKKAEEEARCLRAECMPVQALVIENCAQQLKGRMGTGSADKCLRFDLRAELETLIAASSAVRVSRQ